MQTHGGAAAEKAILAPERHFTWDVQVDWHGNGLVNGGYTGALTDLSPFVQNIRTERGLEGTVPEEVQIVEGASAAEINIVLAGVDPVSGLSMVEIFSEFNKKSPFYGKEIVGAEVRYWIWAETEDGPVQYPQFVGNIRTIEPDRASGEVVLTALDRAEKLRQPVSLTQWAYSHAASTDGFFEGQVQNSQAVMDLALRTGGVSPTPFIPPPPGYFENNGSLGGEYENWGGVIFFLTGTSSVPLVGTCDEPHRNTYFDVEGTGTQMFGHYGSTHPDSPEPGTVPLGLKGKGLNASVLYYKGRDIKAMRMNGAHYLGFTLLTGDGTYWQTASEKVVLYAEVEFGIELRVLVEAGQFWSTWRRKPNPASGITEVIRETPRVNIPTGQPWVRINVNWVCRFSADRLRAQLRAERPDGTAIDTGNIDIHVKPTAGSSGNTETWGRIMVRDHFGLQDIYYYMSSYLADYDNPRYEIVNRRAPYAAVLDPGKLRISHFPVVQSEDGWDLVKEVAGAELGAVFWDENGVFHFWNYDRIKNKRSTVVKTVNPDVLEDMKMVRSMDSLRNEISVHRKKAVASSWRTIHEAQDVDEFRVPPDTFKFFIVQNDDFIAADDEPLVRYKSRASLTDPPGGTLPVWNQYKKHGYVVQRWSSADGWQEFVVDFPPVLAKVLPNGFLLIEVYNWLTQNSVRFAFDSNEAGKGEPAFRVGGSMRVSYDDAIKTYKDDASINKYGRRNLTIDNRWIQFGTPEALYSSYLADRAARVVAVADQEIVMPGDPRIQLGDTLAVRDEDGFGDLFNMQITGITRTFSVDDGLTDEYTVELYAAG